MDEQKLDITVDMYMKLLNMCIELGKLDDTLNAYQTVREKLPQFEFDSIKLLKLVHLLVSNNEENSKLEIIE